MGSSCGSGGGGTDPDPIYPIFLSGPLAWSSPGSAGPEAQFPWRQSQLEDAWIFPVGDPQLGLQRVLRSLGVSESQPGLPPTSCSSHHSQSSLSDDPHPPLFSLLPPSPIPQGALLSVSLLVSP